jgi:hypothetical protein
MTDIAESLRKKGYKALAADSKAGIGFRNSMDRAEMPLKNPVWFDTGLKMKGLDAKGKTIQVSRTICAYDEGTYDDYAERGWSPVKPVKVVNSKKSSKVILRKKSSKKAEK